MLKAYRFLQVCTVEEMECNPSPRSFYCLCSAKHSKDCYARKDFREDLYFWLSASVMLRFVMIDNHNTPQHHLSSTVPQGTSERQSDLAHRKTDVQRKRAGWSNFSSRFPTRTKEIGRPKPQTKRAHLQPTLSHAVTYFVAFQPSK